ncbi:DUF427-domain-containing protein [Daldinia caldariorum]|uniref:DUF427-domain-containing protein n=1 Tax=Daldinia caldariorum TaxID=326644 RepID=UPI0020079CDB|nr:DUF427-domain-containing protein [Daldinia caldariorum]KAI1469332.1 DUF427-domain-containing protein [Daldinia caldariorum]
MANAPGESDLLKLGNKLLEDGPVKTLATPRRVRILFNGAYVADTTMALLVWEHEYYPQYYVSELSILQHLRDPDSWVPGSPYQCRTAILSVGDRATDRVLMFGYSLRNPVSQMLAGMVRVEFGAADAWFEEDVRIYVHPKDPFRRVDVLHSTRALEVRVQGRVVAQTGSAYHLYETGLPCRYYVPPTAVIARDGVRLRDSGTTTACPYKGVANYYHVEVDAGGEGRGGKFEDLVWYYKTPTLECASIAGCLCFYHEKEGVEVRIDGELVQRPKTLWS